MDRRGRTAARRVAGGLLLLVVVLVGVLAYQGVRAAQALRHVQQRAEVLQRQVRADDVTGARATARAIRADARSAHAHTDNALWDTAAHVPWLGRDVAAVQVLSRAADQIATASLDPALEVLGSVRGPDGLRTPDGRFRLDTLASLAPRLERVSTAVAGPAREVAALRPDRLLGPLRGPVGDAQQAVARVDAAARSGATATRLLPGMLGGSGPRTYLLVVQNNAEIRATGGLPGALALLRARDGRISLSRQLSTSDFSVLRRPVLPTTGEERALFGAGYGADLRDLNVDPDWPRAAQMFAATVREVQGVRVDGVLALDPVTLAEVMRATGPVSFTTPQGPQRLTADDVVPLLLHETYVKVPDPADQDVFFAAAARGVFAALVTGRQDPAALVAPAARAVSQRRVLVWSAHADEQARLAGTTVSGSLPDDADAVPHVGVYLNDGTAGKMDYFLRYRGTTTSLRCDDRGRQDVRTRVVLRSVAPRDAARLPAYVTGLGSYVPRGSMQVNVRVYAPRGGRVLALRAGGEKIPLHVLRHDGHDVATVGLRLDPGGRIELEADVRTRDGQRGDPVLRLTPGIEDRTYDAEAPSSCS